MMAGFLLAISYSVDLPTTLSLLEGNCTMSKKLALNLNLILSATFGDAEATIDVTVTDMATTIAHGAVKMTAEGSIPTLIVNNEEQTLTVGSYTVAYKAGEVTALEKKEVKISKETISPAPATTAKRSGSSRNPRFSTLG